MKFVTIKESHYQSELVVLKSRLESEGIECRLKNELTTQILNHIPSFLVELQVPEHHLERAGEIMHEMGETASGSSRISCPRCGSEEVKLVIPFKNQLRLFPRLIGKALLFMPVPMDEILKKGKLKCRNCGKIFDA